MTTSNSKNRKREFEIVCTIKNCTTDFGLGIGVVTKQTVSYNLPKEFMRHGIAYRTARLYDALEEIKNTMIEETFDITVTEV